jgi:hypothetical protein
MIRPHAAHAVPRLTRASDAHGQGSTFAVLTLELALRAVPVIGQTSGVRLRRTAGRGSSAVAGDVAEVPS